jgi:CDGSH-type Zn-finger protein/uncharacterized Fe-S cluster protein YjdI
MSKPRTYAGKDIEISFDMSRCIHARNCFLKLPQVFDPARRPWVDPDAAPAEDIAAMIRTCPSGALTFHRIDSGLEEKPPIQNRVAVLENGPLAFAGDLKVGDQPMTRATLCRCGQSQNKPFCDYAHAAAGFEATGEPPEHDGEVGTGEQGGQLAISAGVNGPLMVKGAMEITTGTGRRVNVVKTAFLCRCGQSKNKPYCDGSHKGAGFEAPEV